MKSKKVPDDAGAFLFRGPRRGCPFWVNSRHPAMSAIGPLYRCSEFTSSTLPVVGGMEPSLRKNVVYNECTKTERRTSWTKIALKDRPIRPRVKLRKPSASSRATRNYRRRETPRRLRARSKTWWAASRTRSRTRRSRTASLRSVDLGKPGRKPGFFYCVMGFETFDIWLGDKSYVRFGSKADVTPPNCDVRHSG
jgi:hypothetical protein